MIRSADQLWRVVRSTPSIDAATLARAVEDAADTADAANDFRTRLLIHDSVRAIKGHWGDRRFRDWLDNARTSQKIQNICEEVAREAQGEHGFPSLKKRIVDATDPAKLREYFRDLSRHVHKPTRLVVGGSIALILSGNLQRLTEDIDVVDEVPEQIRTQYAVLEDLEQRYGLQLAHFQSHYLPKGWERRLRFFGDFGAIQVFLVEPYDVFLTKLFSVRSKDRNDLTALRPRVDRTVLEGRLRESTAELQAEPKLLDAAKTNWYVLFGDELPR